MRSLTLIAAVGLGFSMQAGAQTMPNPGGMAPDTPRMETGNPPKDHSNTADKLFVRQAALGGRAEVELARMAQKKGASDGVRAFAERMQADHTKANEQLLRLGKKASPSIPEEIDPEHKRIREVLNKASGRDFDIAYMTAQVMDHQKTANLLLYELSFGQNAELTRYAADTLPVVMDHLEHAKRELAALSSAPPAR
jgi:putative membrane protein